MPKPSTYQPTIDSALTINISKLKTWGYLKDDCDFRSYNLEWNSGDTPSGKISFDMISIDEHLKEMTLDYQYTRESNEIEVFLLQ